MISLYIDEDVDVLLKPLLLAKSITVITTREEGMLEKEDREQLEHAVKLKSIFLTHNRMHFEQLFNELVKEGKEHYGIITATRRNVYELARRISSFLERHSARDIKNQLWYI
ncbi:MAG: DUF5615 family PIN-like protein [Nitrospinae bacterium]|nr:DUF5615 family PIN-like protein [Nitrospinota bacterium]